MKPFDKLKASLNWSDKGHNDIALALDLQYTDSAEKQINAYEKRHFNGHPPETKAFLQDHILKRCVTILASYATLTSGFNTKTESPMPFTSEEEEKLFETKYAPLKAYIDSVNKKVNMDDIVYAVCIKLTLMGKAACEIVREVGTKKVDSLVKLPVYNNTKDGLQPIIKTKNQLTGFKLKVKDKTFLGEKDTINYVPSKILYFVNNDIDGDWQGISDVQELVAVCINRATLEREMPQILKRIHDPYVISSVDTSANDYNGEGTVEEKKAKLQAHLKGLLAGLDTGSNVVTNNKVTSQIMQLNIDLSKLVEFENKTEDKIIAHFGIPRFLVNRPNVNRATADTEFKAFASGTVAAKQRYIKRVLERCWYDMLTREFLNLPDDAPLPVRIKHVWLQPDVGDMKEKAEVATVLYDGGSGLLGDNPELCLQLAGIYNDKVIEHFNNQQKQIALRQKKPAIV